jgi:GNAT superfamily N-acetyltransferase
MSTNFHKVDANKLRLRGLRVGDLGWIIHRQALLYAQEYGWDASFEGLVAEIAGRYQQQHDPAFENAWVAESDGHVLGSVFLVRESEKVAKLRLLYVEPSARGLGLGGRLTDECICFARQKGYQTLTLWTNSILLAARKIYVARGFELVSSEPHQSFGHHLVGEYWQRSL